MKKILFSLFMIFLFCASSYASCSLNSNFPEIDDEYCVYNQCFFDRQYRKMKKELSFSDDVEKQSDKIYKDFKHDMEELRYKYQKEREKLLDMIVCGVDLCKEQAKYLDDIEKNIQNRRKEYYEDIRKIVQKDKIKEYNHFLKNQNNIMKKILKYGKVYKFPCSNCLG